MMSADKRTVSTDALETLGKIIDETAGRDAIHLAVEPAIAGERLRPGDDVGKLADGTYGDSPAPVGIVDPFLKVAVRKGERFWLVVYPRQITSLRHVWTHPAFPEQDTANNPIVSEDRKRRSEERLRSICDRWEGPDYETFLRLATGQPINESNRGYGPHVIEDNYLCMNGQDASGEIPPEVWDHVENVTGKRCVARPAYFSCSC